MPISLNVHGFVADTRERAADVYYPAHSGVMNRIGRERGWGPTNRAAFDAATGPRGAYAVGDPEAVAEKILFWHGLFGQERTLIQVAIGDVPHREVLRAIELLGTKVAPLVRAELAGRPRATAEAVTAAPSSDAEPAPSYRSRRRAAGPPRRPRRRGRRWPPRWSACGPAPGSAACRPATGCPRPTCSPV